jgi:hypothetical protein
LVELDVLLLFGDDLRLSPPNREARAWFDPSEAAGELERELGEARQSVLAGDSAQIRMTKTRNSMHPMILGEPRAKRAQDNYPSQ